MADKDEEPSCKRQKTAISSYLPSIWELLPDDLWHKIFTHLVLHPRHRYRPLRSVSLICKRFLALFNRALNIFSINPSMKPVPLPSLFSRFRNISSFRLGHDQDLDASITLLADSGLRLQSLHLYDQTHFPKEAMRLLGARMCRTLKSLSCVRFNVMADDDLALVAACFPHLQEFGIKGHCNVYEFVTDQGILELSTNLNSLVSINLLYHDRLTHRSLVYLASNCPCLRDLKFGSIGSIRMDQLNRFDLFRSLSSLHLHKANFSHRVFVQLSEIGLKLEKLSLDVPQITSDVTGEILCRFFKSCRSLRRLKLTPFSFPPDTNAIDFAASLPNIQVVHILLPFDDTVPPIILLRLLESCLLLEEIHIGGSFLGITLDWFDNISTKFLLRRLYFFFCDDLCDETLKLLVSICPKFRSFMFDEVFKDHSKGDRNCSSKLLQY